MSKHIAKWIDNYPIDNKTIVTSLLDSMDWNEPLIKELNDRLIAINPHLAGHIQLICGDYSHLLSDEEIHRLTDNYLTMAINTDFTGEPMIIAPGDLTEQQLWDMYTRLYTLTTMEDMVNDIMNDNMIDTELWDIYNKVGLHPYLDLKALSDDIIDGIRDYMGEHNAQD